MRTTERLSDLTRRYEVLDALDQRKRQLEATTDAVRWLATKATHGTSHPAFLAEQVELRRKAAVLPVTTTDGGTALLPPSTDPIITLIQQQTLPDRLGLRRVPFKVPTPVQAALGTYAWVLQGQPKPAGRIDFTSVTNPPGTISGIVALSRELVKLAPGTEGVVATALTGGAVQFSDQQFLDPAVALVPNGSPASITNTSTPITPTATTLPEQVRELLAALFAGRPETQRPALIAAPAVVVELAAKDPALTVAGGTFSGVPVYPSPAAGSLVVALDAAAVIYSDDGGTIDVSEQATVELNDAAAPPTGATVLTSLWQTNHVGFRVDRRLWWQKVNANAVQTLTVA